MNTKLLLSLFTVLILLLGFSVINAKNMNTPTSASNQPIDGVNTRDTTTTSSLNQNFKSQKESANQRLKDLGYLENKTTTSDITNKEAIRNFQREKKLPVNGNLDSNTLKALGVEGEDKSFSE